MIILGLTIYHSCRFSPTQGKELYKGMDLPTTVEIPMADMH